MPACAGSGEPESRPRHGPGIISNEQVGDEREAQEARQVQGSTEPGN